MNLGERFKEAVDYISFRDSLNIKDICKSIAISAASLSQYKTGAVTPKTKTIEKLAFKYSLNFNYIMLGEGSLEKNSQIELLNLKSDCAHIARVDYYKNPNYNTSTSFSLEDFKVGEYNITSEHPIKDSSQFSCFEIDSNILKKFNIVKGDVLEFNKTQLIGENKLVLVKAKNRINVGVYRKGLNSSGLEYNNFCDVYFYNDNLETIGEVTKVSRVEIIKGGI